MSQQTQDRGSDDAARGLLAATADVDPPFAAVDLQAFWSNAEDLERRAAGKAIRLASKSVRCRRLQEQVLTRPGFSGTLAFTLPEALWLAEHGFNNIVVAYPTTSRPALDLLARRCATDDDLRLALTVDSTDHLDLIGEAGSGKGRIQVVIDVDASWWLLGGRVRIGAKRSPIHTPREAVDLAREIVHRPGLELVGVMAYEAQIAGVADAPEGKPVMGRAIRMMQKASARELARRRAAVVAAVSSVAPVRIVNAGGTGSLETASGEPAVTEVSAGSGLFAPRLFTSYSRFAPRPAAFFVLPVVRRPSERVATALGGGYVASGPAEDSRLPSPWFPRGLRLDRQEGAGEVQTPLLGRAAETLSVDDRVVFRHAKAGELCERFDTLFMVDGDRIVDEIPTYRGEGKTFL